MSNASHVSEYGTNLGPEHLFGKNQPRQGWLSVAMRIVHGTWKAKRANNLAACMGVSQRAAEHVLAGRNAPSSDALIGLLRSGEIGPQLLDALLGDLDWYQYRQNLQRLGELDQERAARQAALDAFTTKQKTRR